MYVCVAEKCEMIDFLVFHSTVVSIDNFPPLPGKNENEVFFKDVCMCKTKTTIAFFVHLSLWEDIWKSGVGCDQILRENPHVEENILPMKLCIFLCKNLKETFHIYKCTVETNRTNWINVAILSQWRKNQTNATNLTIHLLISKHKCKYLEETCENPHSGEKNTTN